MNPIKIYIVEDELLISASLKSQLENYGYQVVGMSTTGNSCLSDLDLLKQENKEPEIVLMDIHLRGELDGIDTARIITEKFHCAIIFLTGQSSREIYDRSFKIKPFGYLLKPIDPEQTKMTIEIAVYQHNLEKENKQYQQRLEALLLENEKEKNELQELYKIIVDNTLVGHCIVQQQEIIFANQAMVNIFEYSLDKMMNLNYFTLLEKVSSEDRHAFDHFYSQIEKGAEVDQGIKFNILKKTGELRWIYSFIRLILLKGNPAFFQTFVDITEQLNTLEELELCKKRVREKEN